MKHQITTDGRTVWVNAPEGMIGRLGPRGIDVHAKPGSNTHCLDCGPLPEDPWTRFVASMKRHHGVTVPQRYRPAWAKERAR